MKRCPECRRDYTDDTLLYCLEDGTLLVQGRVSVGHFQADEPLTAIMSEQAASAAGTAPSESPTRQQLIAADQTSILNTGVEAEPQMKLGDSSKRPSLSAHRAAKLLGGRNKIIAAVGVVAVLLVAGVFAYRYFAPSSKLIESIAVMPFVNEGGNADVEYLSDGMTETLITRLSQLPKLNIKARSSVFRYKGKQTDAKTIGKDLNVQAILIGTLVQRGNDLALHIELVDVQTENALGSSHYYSRSANLVSWQAEIARDVSSKLKIKLSGADEQKLAKNYTENSEAYQLYLKGRFYWYKFPAADYEKSRDYYQQAIDADPNYALAYAGLAEYYGFGAATGFLPPSQENWSKSEVAASKALALDDTLPDAYNALAGVKQFNNDRAGAERDLRRAIELNPNYTEGRNHFAQFLIEVGRSEEALAQWKKVLELEPLSLPFNSNLAWTFY